MNTATTVNRSGFTRRYSRHLLIPEVGLAGQLALAEARVLCVGAGGLGSPVLAYLAAAGVGRIGIVDDDEVDESNLQRQILYREADVGRPKASTAADALNERNSHVAVDVVPVRFDASNARELVRLYDVVVDCTDSFTTRYLINDACVLERVPDVYGSIFRFDGQVSVFATPGGPCLRCLFPEIPPAGSVPTCADGGVLGVLAGMVGTWQAAEAIKLILGIGTPLIGRLALIRALEADVRTVKLERDPGCAVCGDRPTITAVAADPSSEATDDAELVQMRADQLDDFLESDPRAVLLDVREPHEAVLGLHPKAVAIPASQLEARLHELDTANTYVVACRIGERSAWAAHVLRDAQFGRVLHLDGGLLRYAAYVDGYDAF